MKIDISKNELYIRLYEVAHKDYIMPKSIPFCRPRHSDGFVYILGGGCKYTFSDGRSFATKRGDLLYLAKDAVYEMDVLERYDFIFINFFFDGDRERQSDVFYPKDTSICENFFYRALKMQTSDNLTTKMSLIYRIYNEIVLSRSASYLPNSTRAKINEAIATIRESFQGDVSVSLLAARAEMSEVYFRKLFKSVTGVSPSKFIVDCRVSRAKDFLMEDYLTLDEISERCGFSSLSYFCRVFKDVTGGTPGEFRKSVAKL